VTVSECTRKRPYQKQNIQGQNYSPSCQDSERHDTGAGPARHGTTQQAARHGQTAHGPCLGPEARHEHAIGTARPARWAGEARRHKHGTARWPSIDAKRATAPRVDSSATLLLRSLFGRAGSPASWGVLVRASSSVDSAFTACSSYEKEKTTSLHTSHWVIGI